MKTIGYIAVGLMALILAITLAFSLKLGGLQWDKFFKPREMNIQRQVFENTKSYTHGKIQDLAKYYEEYQKGDMSDREGIRAIVQMNFADFDAGKIANPKLRDFLHQMMGY